MSARLAPVVSLAAARARRCRAAPPDTPPPASPAYVVAEPGRVVLRFSDGAELDLSPDHARVWAERLVKMADLAEEIGGGRGSL